MPVSDVASCTTVQGFFAHLQEAKESTEWEEDNASTKV